MATPLNTEAEIIVSLLEKTRLISEQVDSINEGYQNMLAGAQAELEANQKIIDTLSPLAQWDEE